MLKLSNFNISIILFIGCLVTSFLYASFNFEWRNDQIESVNILVDEPCQLLSTIVYVTEENDLGYNFNEVHTVKVLMIPQDSILSFDLSRYKNIRKLRLCVEQVGRDLCLNEVVFRSKNNRDLIDFDYFQLNEELSSVNTTGRKTGINLRSMNGYIETPKTFVYKSDLIRILISGVVIILISLLFSYYFPKIIEGDLSIPNIAEVSIILFITSIFLPHPIFNITLIISLLMVIKNFNFKAFIFNKVNLIFVLLFALLLFNDLFISVSGYHNLKATERYLPLFILPVYISCINGANFLKYFPISAILIGLGMTLTSLISFGVSYNLNCFSFEEFAKFTHPVYFSYLLSFSMIYVFLKSKLASHYKNILQLMMFLFLILAGSKMVISLTLLFYGVLFIKNKKAIIAMIIGVVLLAFFPPVQKRFQEIINVDDLSIINETKVEDVNDPRVNGLTLRVLLWQETLKTINTLPKFLTGLGVDDASNEALKLNMENRGLSKYKKYSTHNQFINFYMRTGVVGFGILFCLILYIFYQAIKNKNKMLFIMIVMFTFAMLTESVLQRVLGIYFFTTVLLFLTKPAFLNENSDNWN